MLNVMASSNAIRHGCMWLKIKSIIRIYDGMLSLNGFFPQLFERLVRICMHAHTTITPFMHDLHIACKNMLISHNFMMHANACCTCNLISTCTK